MEYSKIFTLAIRGKKSGQVRFRDDWFGSAVPEHTLRWLKGWTKQHNVLVHCHVADDDGLARVQMDTEWSGGRSHSYHGFCIGAGALFGGLVETASSPPVMRRNAAGEIVPTTRMQNMFTPAQDAVLRPGKGVVEECHGAYKGITVHILRDDEVTVFGHLA